MSESVSVVNYRLSDAADRDLRLMFEYGLDSWGEHRARAFLERITNCLSDIAANPLLFPAVEAIRTGYRRRVFEGHSIYYRLEGSDVVIARILGRQDPAPSLAEG